MIGEYIYHGFFFLIILSPGQGSLASRDMNNHHTDADHPGGVLVLSPNKLQGLVSPIGPILILSISLLRRRQFCSDGSPSMPVAQLNYCIWPSLMHSKDFRRVLVRTEESWV